MRCAWQRKRSSAASHGWASISDECARNCAPKAITAEAHQLARIVFHMLTTGQAYDETVFAQPEVQNNQRMQQRLRQQAKQLGCQLVEIPAQ
jgi:transposase